MAYSAKVLKDSVSPDGARLTTLEVTFPRIVLAEFNTHRVFSRNSASSRAIPVEKMLKKIADDPFVPIYWGKNQRGMQAEVELTPAEQAWAETEWLEARDKVVKHVEQLLAIGVHKQITNRLLEPWLWHTVIVTSTEWSNWDSLRRHREAQPEIRTIAELMKQCMDASVPSAVDHGEWHLPLIEGSELFDMKVSGMSMLDIIKVSIGRCARVSYLTHDGKRDPRADIELCERLIASGHMSPTEHVATPLLRADCRELLTKPGVVGVDLLDIEVANTFCGNFRGWRQVRKLIAHESDFSDVSSDRIIEL